MTAQGHTGKAYHRFWSEHRLDKPGDVELPLWVKGVALLILVAVYCLVVIGVIFFVTHIWFKIQTTHVDWCADAGGKMSVGSFYYVSCYDLTPRKKGE